MKLACYLMILFGLLLGAVINPYFTVLCLVPLAIGACKLFNFLHSRWFLTVPTYAGLLYLSWQVALIVGGIAAVIKLGPGFMKIWREVKEERRTCRPELKRKSKFDEQMRDDSTPIIPATFDEQMRDVSTPINPVTSVDINPATGLFMVDDCFDSGGNAYGFGDCFDSDGKAYGSGN